MELLEKLIHQLRIADEEHEELPSWEEIYGIGKRSIFCLATFSHILHFNRIV